MMRYLISGSSGFVGRHLLTACQFSKIDYEIIRRKDYSGEVTLPEGNFPVVIHLAGKAHVLKEAGNSKKEDFYKANCEYALKVAKAAVQNGLIRFIYISSIAVYGKSTSEQLIGEASELKPVDDYGKSKLEAECKLKALSEELGFELVIVRPALVYGYDAPGNIQRLLNLTAKLPIIPIAEKKNQRSLIYVKSLVDFLLLVAVHPSASGKVFNIADDSISTYELIANLASGMDRSPMLFSLPRTVWNIILRAAGKQKIYEQLFEDLVLDTSLAQLVLDWKPKHDNTTALMETGRCFIADHNQRTQGDSQ